MSIRSVIVYALLFIAACAAAWFSWTPAVAHEAAEGVVLLQATPEDLESVAFRSEEIDVTLTRRSDERGTYVWAETTTRRKPGAPPPDPHGSPAADTDGGPTEQSAAFKAGVTADQLFEDLAPFRVSRRLEVGPDRIAEFGFDDPRGELVITTRDKTRTAFEIGDTGYGHRHVYLRDEQGRVYVAENSLVGPLERADTRLPDKRLFDFERANVERATISTGNDSLQLVQRNREDAAAARWTEPGAEEPAESAQSWLDKLFRLRSSGYVPEDAADFEREVAFSVKLEPADAPPVVVTVSRGAGAEAAPAWYAQSDFTRGLVELNSSIAADIADDLGTLFTTP